MVDGGTGGAETEACCSYKFDLGLEAVVKLPKFEDRFSIGSVAGLKFGRAGEAWNCSCLGGSGGKGDAERGGSGGGPPPLPSGRR